MYLPFKTSFTQNFTIFQLQLTESDPTPRNLVVCFSPLYFYENWQILLATIELYRFYGADLLVIPLLSVVTRLYTILRSYERDGRVRIKSPVVAPMFVSKREHFLTFSSSARSRLQSKCRGGAF